ncbi:MAG: hypothetical protein IIT84_06520, partial [Oscillospiraceae bacterium]|nr:hypothetical protein [Oscillospiraceae bacterium]
SIDRWDDMMNSDKELLILSAARLYSVGVDLEAARARLKELVDQDVSYSDERMIKAYNDFNELKAQWDSLEKQHLELRNEITGK